MGEALVYDPFLSTLGGGERYALALAAVLGQELRTTVGGPRVEPSRIRRMGLGSSVPLVPMDDRAFTRASADVDVAVVVANRLPPPTRARRSFVVVQFPFPGSALHHPGRAVRRTKVLERYRAIVYSEFVRTWCRRRWRTDATVIHPPVARPDRQGCQVTPSAGDEPPTILSVGRFFAGDHSKRQDVLIGAFRALLDRHDGPAPRLVLAGGSTDSSAGRRYLRRVQRLAEGLPVTLAVDVDHQALCQLYERATLFWHATGFGRGQRHPERAEHFGISTVEAMARGVVPLVYDDGGAPEILTEDCGIRWHSFDQLVQETATLLADEERRLVMATAARARSDHFTPRRFEAQVRAVVLDQS